VSTQPPAQDSAAVPQALLLDRVLQEAFDRLTRLATTVLHAPVSLVTLVDAARPLVVSSVGLPEPWASTREAPFPDCCFINTGLRGEQPTITSR